MHVFYLHGFASSARSSKATFFATRLSRLGITVHVPDFNEPDFSTLTITRMIGQVTGGIEAVRDDLVVLIGSSLGAFIAVQTALKHPGSVDRMVLLAPALDFGPSTRSGPAPASSSDSGNRLDRLGDRSVDEWQRTNRLEVFHYGFGRVMPVHFELHADACRYDCLNAQLEMPIQVFQGRRDTAVDPETVERWAGLRPNVELHMLDDDHQLLGSLEHIWDETRRFLRITR